MFLRKKIRNNVLKYSDNVLIKNKISFTTYFEDIYLMRVDFISYLFSYGFRRNVS
jgi:hypothetical protein